MDPPNQLTNGRRKWENLIDDLYTWINKDNNITGACNSNQTNKNGDMACQWLIPIHKSQQVQVISIVLTVGLVPGSS